MSKKGKNNGLKAREKMIASEPLKFRKATKEELEKLKKEGRI